MTDAINSHSRRMYNARKKAPALEPANPLDDPRVKALVEAGKAVVDRWDSPLWKDLPHTGESIAELRATLSALEENK